MKMRKLVLTLSLPCSPSPEVGSGFWKLSDQPLKYPHFRYRSSQLVMTRVHVPLASRPAKRRKRHLRVECGEEWCDAVLDRSRRIIIEDRVGEICVSNATPDAAE